MSIDRDELRIRDMLAAVQSIERYWNLIGFDESELLQSHVLLRLQMIGEAAAAMSAESKSTHAAIPWREIVALRNILVHHYWQVDLDQVRAIVLEDLPTLRDQLRDLLDD